jgi:hypothetical protein
MSVREARAQPAPPKLSPAPNRRRLSGLIRVTPAREHFAATLIFAVLTVGFFNPIFRADATFSDVAGHQTAIYPWAAYPNGFSDAYPQSDQADSFYPWQVFINKSIRDGVIPLWDPYTYGGSPFHTNGGGGATYPLRLLPALVVSASWVHDLFMLFHVFLASVAMYGLLRSVGTGFLPGLLSGVAWAFSSFTFAWIQLEFALPIAVALPASIALMRKAVVERRNRHAVTTGVVLGLGTFGTALVPLLLYPLVLGYGALLGVGRRLRRPIRWREPVRGLSAPVIAGVVALGTSSLVLLPTLMLAEEIGRKPAPYDVLKQSAVPLSAFLHVFWPDMSPVSTDLLHEMTFVGSAAALLALVGLLARGPGAWLGRVLAAGTLLLTVGTPLTWLAYRGWPGFAFFRPWGRALFLWCFAIALLAGLGLDLIQRRSRRGSLSIGGLRLDSRVLGRGAAALGVVVILLTVTQLFRYDRRLNPPFQPRQAHYLYPATPAIQALERDHASRPPEEPQRLLPVRRTMIDIPWTPPTMYASHSMVFGLESAAGYQSVFPERIAAIWRVIGGEAAEHVIDHPLDSAFLPSFFPGQMRFDLLPQVGVTTLYAPPDIGQDPGWVPNRYAPLQMRRFYSGPDGQVFDILGQQPRAYVVHGIERVDSERAALVRFADHSFDFRKRLILEPEEANEAGPERAAARQGDVTSHVVVRDLGINTESYSVQTDRPGWLVVTSMWDPGWRATVDGESAEVLRANYNQRAVLVPAGRSRVDLEYRPRGLEVGAAITALTLLVPVILFGLALVRRRRARASRRPIGAVA